MIERFEHFALSISSLYRYMQKIERVEMEKYNLKGPHAQCMITMLRYPEGVTSAQLCELCDKDKAAVSRTVAELEQAGMIQRNTNSGNRYRARLVLTETGREAALAVTQTALLAVEQAGSGLTEEQRQHFYFAMDLIAQNLGRICEEGLPERKE